MNTKASHIRRLLRELGNSTRNSEIVRRLKDDGVEVTPQQVSNEKARFSRNSDRLPIDDLPVSVLKKVKNLVDEIGSSAIVRRALDELDLLSLQHHN